MIVLECCLHRRNILLTTFFGKPFNLYYLDIYEDGPHIISIFYRVFAILWLFALELYVAYNLKWFERSASCPDEQGELVTGVVDPCKLLRSYPKNSELVVSGASTYGWFKCDLFDAFEDEMAEEEEAEGGGGQG